MLCFSINFVLAVLATSVLMASAAPLHYPKFAARAAASQDQFTAACAEASIAGSLTGAAVTLLDQINSNDQGISSDLLALKGVLSAVSASGDQVASLCGSNSGNTNSQVIVINSNSISSNSNSNNNNNKNSNSNSKSKSPSTQSNNNVGGGIISNNELSSILNSITAKQTAAAQKTVVVQKTVAAPKAKATASSSTAQKNSTAQKSSAVKAAPAIKAAPAVKAAPAIKAAPTVKAVPTVKA
ncbi:hypothetical protein C8R44DRAFT_882195 [Mycena epipterygia]|nr:hypothetical protein C8R44DRAFT_882195 [Mycena epipterygia]